MASIESPKKKIEFPSFEQWVDEQTKIHCYQEETITNAHEEDTPVIKTYNDRRLSNSFPDIEQISTKSFNSAVRKRSISLPDFQKIPSETCNTATKKELKNILSLMLVQGLTSNSISEKGVASFLPYLPRKEREEQILNILQSLVTVLKTAVNSPTETQIFDYCKNVLEVVAADEHDTVIVIFFFRSVLLSQDTLLKHAGLALLHSYCSKRRFGLYVSPGLLSDVIAMYKEDDPKVLEWSANVVTAIIQNLKHTDQMKLVSDVCLAVKCAMFRSKVDKRFQLEDKHFLPGLCHSKGFDSIFAMYEKVILKGIMKDKRLAVRALEQLILFSSEEALQSSLCSLASVLTCVLIRYMSEPYTLFKITLVETLTTLIAKVGIKLKPYFRRFETTFLKLVRCDDHTVQLKSIRALCCLSRFDDQMENFYIDIFDGIRNEGYMIKRRLVFALRCIIKCSCIPLPENVHRKFLVLILSLMDNPSESIRTIAAGCMGTMIVHLQGADCEKVVKLYLLDDDQTASWSLRHSKCTALLVALKESPAKLLQGELEQSIFETLLSYLLGNIPKLICCALAASGYYMLHKFQVQEEINPVLIYAFCEKMNHSSEDVSNAFGVIIVFLANKVTLPLPFMKMVAPHLIHGTAGKKSKLQLSCEFALAAMLNLYNEEEISQMYLDILDKDAQDILQGDLIHRLKIIATKPRPKQTEIDAFTRL